MVVGELHVLPLKIDALPPLSTAMQNAVVGHDTGAPAKDGSMMAGADHPPTRVAVIRLGALA
jgi:hypothetical protein